MPYKALKHLAVAERPPPWDPGALFPSASDRDAAEEMAKYFSGISQVFAPVDQSVIPRTHDREVRTLTEQEIIDRLTHMKKPKSSVTGDPLSKLVNMHAIEFAPVLSRIFNLVRSGSPWPDVWRTEEVTVIPKGNEDAVDSLDGCRNISCTSIFSKLLRVWATVTMWADRFW